MAETQKYAVRVGATDLRTEKPYEKYPYLVGPFDCESEADDYAVKWTETQAKKIGKPYARNTHESDYGAIEKDVIADRGLTIVRVFAETIRMEDPDWDAVLPPETMEEL